MLTRLSTALAAVPLLLAALVQPAPAQGGAGAAAPTARGAGRARGTLIVLNKADATASFVDLATMRVVATLPTGAGPHEVAVSPDGRMAVIGNYGAQTPGNSLTVVDLRRRAVVRTIDLGEHRRPHGIAWLADGRRVAVTTEASRAVVVVDVASGAVRPIPTDQQGTHLLALSPDRRRGYTANIGSNSVSLLDLERGTLVRTVTTRPRPEAIDVSPDGRELWTAPQIAPGAPGMVTILDAATLDSVAAFPSGGVYPNRLRFTPDGRLVLVSHAASGNVQLFDARTRAPVATIPFPRDTTKAPADGGPMSGSAVPLGILITPDSRTAFVATAAHNEIAIVDIPARRIVATLRTGNEPDGMALAPR
jgi:DNA-binding beta-propeller fold protein YncE